MEKTRERIGKMGLVPVVVFEKTEDALPTAKAIMDGGLSIMEITLRTEFGIPSIEAIKKTYPQMLLGAGTVLSVDQAKKAVGAGAEFIVSPGFDNKVVSWCRKNNVMITPGCVTPTEIVHALSFGIDILKFFPASIYGGVDGCRALYGPYRMVKFIPTGGISLSNLSEYSDKDFIHAIGGGWLCSSKDIQSGNFEKITKIVINSIDTLLGFELVHDEKTSIDKKTTSDIVEHLNEILGFEIGKAGDTHFVKEGIELIEGRGIRKRENISILTNSIDRAEYYLSKRGFKTDEKAAVYKDGKKISIYLENEAGKFGVCLLQK